MKKALYYYNSYHMLMKAASCDSKCSICYLRFQCWTSTIETLDIEPEDYDKYMETRK